MSATDNEVLGDTIEQDESEEHLLELAKKLKLEVYDLDEGIYGYASTDHRYAIEVVRTTISFDDSQDSSLGLVLTEMAHGDVDDRGLVMITDVSGNAVKAEPGPIHVGDLIAGVIVKTSSNHHKDSTFRERTIGLNYDSTVEVIADAKNQAVDGKLTLEINRLVKRADITVQVLQEGEDGQVQQTTIEALAGENLRRLLLRKGISLYDGHTKRFDMPFATGDCAGEGLCGTCLVAIERGQELLNHPKNPDEEMITRGRPLSWRASCRTIVGADNQPGTIVLRLKPQSQMSDELDRGVRPIK